MSVYMAVKFLLTSPRDAVKKGGSSQSRFLAATST